MNAPFFLRWRRHLPWTRRAPQSLHRTFDYPPPGLNANLATGMAHRHSPPIGGNMIAKLLMKLRRFDTVSAEEEQALRGAV